MKNPNKIGAAIWLTDVAVNQVAVMYYVATGRSHAPIGMVVAAFSLSVLQVVTSLFAFRGKRVAVWIGFGFSVYYAISVSLMIFFGLSSRGALSLFGVFLNACTAVCFGLALHRKEVGFTNAH